MTDLQFPWCGKHLFVDFERAVADGDPSPCHYTLCFQDQPLPSQGSHTVEGILQLQRAWKLCWAALVHPALPPDHSWVKLLLLFGIYIWAKLLDDGKHSPEVSDFFFQENKRTAGTHMT